MSLLSLKQIDLLKDDDDEGINEHLEELIETAVAKTKKKRKTHKQVEEQKETEEIHHEEEEEEGIKKKKKKKKHIVDRRKIEEEEKEMRRHESILFGSLYSATTDFGVVAKNAANDGPALFFTDRSAGQMIAVQEADDELEIREDEVEDKKPAWEDEEEKSVHINIANTSRLRKLRTAEDENSISVSDFSLRSRAAFVKINPVPKWAQLGSKNYDESDEDIGVVVDYADEGNERNDGILRTNEELVMKSSGKLFPGLLEYSRLVDANAEDPSNGPINSVQFHRNAQLLLAAGLDRKLRFFQIDGKRNTMIQKPIFLEDCPIRKASFLPDGSQVIASGRRKFFYSFDLVNAKFDRIGPLTGRDERSLENFEVSPDSRTIAFLGNEGYILLVSCKTKELIGTMKMNGTARSLAFTDDGKQLLSSGGDGHIYHWDLRTMTCFHKAVDEGCLTGSSLCTSPNGALFAAGSSSGIVNIYNQEEFLGGKRKPMKTIENLTTKVDFMKFNHDGQILAICSRMQKNSLKLVHVPSFSVFSNWPPPKTILHHPRCLDFSPGGGFMAMGNADGKVLLYKLHQYQHA